MLRLRLLDDEFMTIYIGGGSSSQLYSYVAHNFYKSSRIWLFILVYPQKDEEQLKSLLVLSCSLSFSFSPLSYLLLPFDSHLNASHSLLLKVTAGCCGSCSSSSGGCAHTTRQQPFIGNLSEQIDFKRI